MRIDLNCVIAALLAALIAAPAFAQMPANVSRAVQIADARRANAALMHQYNWNSRTEIIINSQVKDTRIEQVFYNPSGQLQHILLNDQKASAFYLPTPLGFLRRAIADNEKQELEQFLTGLKGMLQQYTLPTTGKILDFMTSAQLAGPDANGLFHMSGNNVVTPGDNLTLTVNPWTQHLTRLQVSTTFQGDAVQLDATFATVPGSGLNYASFAEITVPSKQLSVQVQNYNYYRSN